jgi:hypothetical protein
VVAEVEAGRLFEVHITPGAVQTLGLGPATHVWLVIKTHSFRRVAAPPDDTMHTDSSRGSRWR